jgi:ubiquinone/menaquinone biosynthesis C-methylase UbiE
MPFEELKAKQSVMWGSGPYERITDTIRDIHHVVIDRLGPQPGDRWLDLATGTGAVALLAARAGAEVTGQDLAPALIETARENAAAQGLAIGFEVGDAENLSYEDASFDVVSSTCGVMFAPDHGAVASELARVCRPGGRIALACWRPEGTIGDMFRTMAPFQPPAAPGVGSPFEWGKEGHVTDLLGEAFELEFEELVSVLEEESGEAVWELFVTSYGPTKTLAGSLEADRREELHRAFVDLHESHRANGGIRMARTYLLTTGRRR